MDFYRKLGTSNGECLKMESSQFAYLTYGNWTIGDEIGVHTVRNKVVVNMLLQLLVKAQLAELNSGSLF